MPAKSNTGMQTAARASAPSVSAASGMHTFVAMQNCTAAYHGGLLSFIKGVRYIADSPLKAHLQNNAVDLDLVWET
jgi:hypothetical protein